MPTDPYFTCYRGLEMQAEFQPSVAQGFAQDRLNQFCDLNAGTTLSSSFKMVSQTYLHDFDSQVTLSFSANWQIGDSSCANRERVPSLEECKDKLGSVLNNCDTDSIEIKYGGSNVVDCIDWTMTVAAYKPPVSNPPVCLHM